MLSHGGCIARGEDAAHVFALVHGVVRAARLRSLHVLPRQPAPRAQRWKTPRIASCDRLLPLSPQDAAAEIQVYAEMTGFPLMEIPKETVRSLPPHPLSRPLIYAVTASHTFSRVHACACSHLLFSRALRCAPSRDTTTAT